MTMMEAKIKQWGNSFGVIIPKDIIKHESLHKGDEVKINLIKAKRIDGFGLFKGIPKFKEEEESHKKFW